MSEESGFKLIIINQSNNDRMIRVVVAVALIAMCFFMDLSMGNFIGTIGLVVVGTLLFNAISGNCYIYRMLGINTCPISEPGN